MFQRILTEDPPPNDSIPPELDSVIRKAMEKDRELRYQTAGDLRADLKRLKRDSSSGRVHKGARWPGLPEFSTALN
jgi:hypothetical protein